MLHHAHRIDRGGRHQVMGGRQPRRGSIIQHHAVVAQHHAVAAAADGEGVPAVDVHPIQEFGDIVSLQLDLAQRRDVDQANVGAHVFRLAVRSVVWHLPGARIRVRTRPESRVDEARAMRDVPVVHRRVACRLEMRTGFLARIGAEGDGGVGRAESRGTDCGNRPMKLLGEEREADDIAGLALVGAHPQRGVALEMLDRAEAFARRQRDVRRGDVVLKVDEGFLD